MGENDPAWITTHRVSHQLSELNKLVQKHFILNGNDLTYVR